jgi:hypothetical protein
VGHPQVTLSAAKLGAGTGGDHEKARPGGICPALIDEKIKALGDWRGKTLAKVREIIHEADPEIVEGRERLSGTVSLGCRSTLDANGSQTLPAERVAS